MAPPPAKKQKRLIVLSSDDEGESAVPRANTAGYWGATRSIPTRPHVRASNPSKPKKQASTQTIPVASPKKPKGESAKPNDNKKSRSLYTFFNAATQTQRATLSCDLEAPEIEDQEKDLIQDDSLDEGSVDLSKLEEEAKIVFDRQKWVTEPHHRKVTSTGAEKLPSASQKFKKTSHLIDTGDQSGDGVLGTSEDARPWTEKYAPTCLNELAVHKKKVVDLRSWLERVIQGTDHKRLLVVKGPSGSGKTATVSLVAKAMGISVSEWRNPTGSELSSEGFLSMSAQFEDFLGRSGRFGSLSFHGDSQESLASGALTPTSTFEHDSRRLILLEEFPNTFTRTSSALQSFRSSIFQYLSTNTPSSGAISFAHVSSPKDIVPLILIISETLLTTSTASADSFTAHRLLGPEILNHPGTSVIEFNPIATTILSKALDLIVQKEARHSGRRKMLGSTVRKKLGEVGDIRSAIGSLEFLCLRGFQDGEWGGRVATKNKGPKNEVALMKMEKESMEMVTQREASLGIFHAVGKVVYNKRGEVDSELDPITQPPEHLQSQVRTKISEVDVDHLIDEIGTDVQTFIAALHENYVLSCDDPSATNLINECIDALSDSDILNKNRGSGYIPNSVGGAQDTLRQDEICFQLAVRGILFALPFPVKRRAALSGRGGRHSPRNDSFKMFYPMSLRLWKQTEEIESLVDAWVHRSMKDNFRIANNGIATSNPQNFGGVASWKSNTSGITVSSPSSAKPTAQAPYLLGCNSGREETLTEILPYLSQIYSRRSTGIPADLEKITHFHGIKAPGDDDESAGAENDDGVEPFATEWATDRPTEKMGKSSTEKTSSGVGVRNGTEEIRRAKEAETLENVLEKQAASLVLTDDDIEDD